jgi:hypothetical protein
LYRVLDGIKYRQHDEKSDNPTKTQKAAITFDLLCRMLNHLEAKKKNFNKDIYDLHNPHLLQAIFTIAFFSGARISELTFSNMKKFTHCKALKLKHNIWFGLEQFSILKSTTKADQFGLRSDLHFGRTNHHIACPVTIMKNYFNARKAAMEALDDDAYLFACRQSNGIIAAMTD